MFYCNNCALKNKWPMTMMTSHGACEMCNKTTVCNDTPSRYLPDPPVYKPYEPPKEEIPVKLGPTPDDKLTPTAALRWLDQNAGLIKEGLTMNTATKDKFDQVLDVLWEAILNGK